MSASAQNVLLILRRVVVVDCVADDRETEEI